MKMNCVVGFLSLTILLDIVLLGACDTYKPLQWSPLNPLFQATSDGNTSAYRINVKMYSRFNIICPNPANNPVTIKTQISKENMFENIWSVDKNSFDTCIVNSTNNRNSKVSECNEPLKLNYYTMIFLPTTSISGQPEFEYGKDHYFIATSNGTQDSLRSTALGHCHTNNMRFIIYVCRDNNDPSCKTNTGPDPQDKTVDNQTTNLPPTDRNLIKPPVAAGRKANCFISAHETIWLILVCVLGSLMLVLLLGHIFLCCRKRGWKSLAAGRANLILDQN
ncbi:ephrin-B1-like [Actinia tenebrosa]|uniref:Ephrin-B1-like n=1 Tax=Actinia tenebrosa TaxID=6105 RepID=A0A6P8ILX1_ACTTE|nr:ephrin-B1-like [Actinia tenebrosa]